MTRPTVSIIMLTWNHQAVTVEAIGHVLMNAGVPTELIVVDNASTDGTRSFLDRLPASVGPVTIVRINNAYNVGFPAGVNQGLARATGEYVVWLNNDVLVPRHWDRDLLADLARHPEVGLVGPVTNWATGPQRRDASYAVTDFLPFAAAWRQRPGHSVQPTSRLVGFCLMARRAVVDAIGGLDVRFSPGMFEDDDWGVRALMAGFRLGISTRVFVHHFGSVSFGEDVERGRELLRQHARWFRHKWGGREIADAAALWLPLLPTIAPSPGSPPMMGVAPSFQGHERRALEWAHLVGRSGTDLPWLLLVDPEWEDEHAVTAAWREVAQELVLEPGRDFAVMVERYPYSQYLSRLAVAGSRLLGSDAGISGWLKVLLEPFSVDGAEPDLGPRERALAVLWRQLAVDHA